MNKFTVIAKKASVWEVVDGKQKRISKARFDAILSQKIVKTEKRENETIYHVEELLSFDELPENVQTRVIEENRYMLVDDGGVWFEHLKDEFRQTLELLGFSNIRFTLEKSISFTAEWDARHIVNNPAMWESQQAYAKFSPFMRVMGLLGGTAKIAERCYITAGSVLDELVLEEMYNNICYMYSKLLDEKNG